MNAVHEWFRPWLSGARWSVYLLMTSLGYLAYEFGFAVRTKVMPDLSSVRFSAPDILRARLGGAILVVMGCVGYLMFMIIYGFDVALTTNIRYKSNAVEANWLGALFLYTRVWIFIGFLILFICHLKDHRAGFRGAILLLFLFCLVIYTSIQGASRAYFLYLILLPGLCYVVAGRRLPIGWIAAFGIGFPIILVFGRTVLAYELLSDPLGALKALRDALVHVDMASLAGEIVAAFAHPFASTIVVIEEITVSDYRYFLDLPMAILFYFKAFGVDFGYSVTYIHTYILSSEYNSNIPPGIIASGYYQLGVAGVFIFLFLFGVLSRFAQNLLGLRSQAGPAHIAIFVYLNMVLGNFVMNGDPRVSFIEWSLIAIAFAVIIFVEKVTRRRSLDRLRSIKDLRVIR